jgi:hypothetical protein
VKVGSTRGRLSRKPISTVGERACCACVCGGGGVRASESLRFASAFLFLGTSCSLKGSAAEEGAGDACWLCDRLGATGESAISFLLRRVSTKWSDCCRPFSWYAMCGLTGGRLSAEADRELFSFSSLSVSL